MKIGQVLAKLWQIEFSEKVSRGGYGKN